MNRKELKKAFEEGLIDEQRYKDELFKLATQSQSLSQRKKKKLPVAISEEEFTSLVSNTKDERYRLAFLFGFGAGLRLSEIVGGMREDGSIMEPLTKDKIDLQRKTILIKDAKGGKDRIVPLPKGFKDVHLKLLPLTQGFSNIKSARRSMEQTFRNSCKKAKLLDTKPELHFHSLRHGFGSQLANKGVPIHHIRTMMGHSNISTTNVYLEMNPKDALKAYEDLF
jgi:integrase/recombinase XerD